MTGVRVKTVFVLATLLAAAVSASAQSGFGAVQTSDVNGTTNINEYASFNDIYLNGGGGGGGQILDAGYYAYVIGDQNLTTQVTTVGTFNRSTAQGGTVRAMFNLLSGVVSPFSPAGDTGGSGVSLTGNLSSTGVYKLAVYQLSTDPTANFAAPVDFAGLSGYASKTDNFKVANATTAPVPEPGSMALLAMGGLPLLSVLRRRRR